MSDRHTITDNNGHASPNRGVSPPRPACSSGYSGFASGRAREDAKVPHAIALAGLLSAHPRPETLPDFLAQLGDGGLGLACVDGEPAVFPISGRDCWTLDSLGLLQPWLNCVREWESRDRPQPSGDNLIAVDEAWARHDPLGRSLTPEQRRSVLWFLKRLPAGEVSRAVVIAARKLPDAGEIGDRFRYFCGICHNKIAERGRGQWSSN